MHYLRKWVESTNFLFSDTIRPGLVLSHWYVIQLVPFKVYFLIIDLAPNLMFPNPLFLTFLSLSYILIVTIPLCDESQTLSSPTSRGSPTLSSPRSRSEPTLPSEGTEWPTVSSTTPQDTRLEQPLGGSSLGPFDKYPSIKCPPRGIVWYISLSPAPSTHATDGMGRPWLASSTACTVSSTFARRCLSDAPSPPNDLSRWPTTHDDWWHLTSLTCNHYDTHGIRGSRPWTTHSWDLGLSF